MLVPHGNQLDSLNLNNDSQFDVIFYVIVMIRQILEVPEKN